MITTNEGWKNLNEKFYLGVNYRWNGVYMRAIANCFTKSIPEDIRNQWHIHEDGEWICETGNCEFCHEHYRGNVYIGNNRIVCVRNSNRYDTNSDWEYEAEYEETDEEYHDTYDETTANFDDKEFTFSKLEITTRKEFLDHQARQILTERSQTQEIIASPKLEKTPKTPQK